MYLQQSNSGFISVVITAFNRRKYLLRAIMSVLSQDLNRGLYEILVIKNFQDQDIDSFCIHNEVKVLTTEDLSIGEYIKMAYLEARGSLIVFLDDDDYFTPNKLSRVYNIFITDSEVVYYHHNRIFIDESGKVLKDWYKPLLFIGFSDDVLKLIKSLTKDFSFGSLFHNTSSIAIRKEVLESVFQILNRITYDPDGLLFFSALSLNKKMVFNDDKLTYYLVHDSSSQILATDRNLALEKLSKNYIENIRSLQFIAYNVNNSEIRKIIECRINNLIITGLFKTRMNSFNMKRSELLLRTLKCIRNRPGNILRKIKESVGDSLRVLLK